METWAEMARRHARERRQVVERLAAQRLTQTQAARRLGMNLTALNNYINRAGIHWPYKAQGKRQ